MKKAIILLFVVVTAFVAHTGESNIINERLTLFNQVKAEVAKQYWPGFLNDKMQAPLVYFHDTICFVANTKKFPFNNISVKKVIGNKKEQLYVCSTIDKRPFIMENKMNFSDKNSPFYYSPIMLCSGVEQTLKTIPDFTCTEHWIQLVMHEYFHAFQFKHTAIINYLADTIKTSADTLITFYRNDTVFNQKIKTENQLLLKAIYTSNNDSVKIYIHEFKKVRQSRKEYFIKKYKFDISLFENFWEKTEGPARYVEYYCGYIYHQWSNKNIQSADSLFKHFGEYKDEKFYEGKLFKEREQIMPAYYYVTGFNMCRLLDKLKVDYKIKIFNNGKTTLYQFL